MSGYPKTSHKYTLFLFTDILVVGSGQVGHRRNRKLKLKEVFRLRGVEVSLIKDAPVSQHCFQILKAGAGAEPLIQLAAAEMLERKEWIDAITAQQEELASLLGSDEVCCLDVKQHHEAPLTLLCLREPRTRSPT